MNRSWAIALTILLLLAACAGTPSPTVPATAPTIVPMPTLPSGVQPQDVLLSEGTPAPDFSLVSIDNHILGLDSFAGRPLVLVFFSPFCTACQVELPGLQAQYATYQDQGLAVLGIVRYDRDLVKTFVRDFELEFPILLDEAGQVSAAYQAYVVPTTYFVDGEGLIRAAVVGGPQTAGEVKLFLESHIQMILP